MTEKPLHDPQTCLGKEEDVEKMRNQLLIDPGALERPQSPPQFCGYMTPLQSAAHTGHELCAKFLLESGAHVDSWNERGYTALYVATYAFEPSVVSLLLQYGASPNYLSRGSNTTSDHSKSWYLYLACSFGFMDIARALAEHGAAPEEFFPNGCSTSAAQVSALKNHPECLLLALKHGAVTDFHQIPSAFRFEELRYYSLLHFSIQGKSFHNQESLDKVIKIWTILQSFGANFWFKDKKGRTVLDRLIGSNQFPEKQSQILESNMRQIMSQPPKLQDLSRIAIRNVMGVDYHKNVCKFTCLPLPLIGYLNFVDLD